MVMVSRRLAMFGHILNVFYISELLAPLLSQAAEAAEKIRNAPLRSGPGVRQVRIVIGQRNPQIARIKIGGQHGLAFLPALAAVKPLPRLAADFGFCRPHPLRVRWHGLIIDHRRHQAASRHRCEPFVVRHLYLPPQRQNKAKPAGAGSALCVDRYADIISESFDVVKNFFPALPGRRRNRPR